MPPRGPALGWALNASAAALPAFEGMLGVPFVLPIWGTELMQCLPCRGPELGWALNVSAAALPAFEAMLGVPFALPKLDLAALPVFADGGMENWGLVLFPEASLLTGNASGVQQRREVAVVVAHELAHMVRPQNSNLALKKRYYWGAWHGGMGPGPVPGDHPAGWEC